MVRWQYLECGAMNELPDEIILLVIPDHYRLLFNYPDSPVTLNTLGEDGWNLTAVIGHRCIFRRSVG